MTRNHWLAAILFAQVGCGGATVPRSPNASPNAAEYELTFTGTWTSASHPLEYPEAGLISGPHFSGLIGATHDGTYHIIREGEMPTPGLERLSEEGKHSPLDGEIRQMISGGSAGTLFESGPVKDLSRPVVTVRFIVDENHPMVSFVAMIAPSPDWFTGASDVALFEDGAWVSEKSLDLVAWDSGGDDGTTYKADDRDNQPKRATMVNASPHFQKAGQANPVAHVVLRKL